MVTRRWLLGALALTSCVGAGPLLAEPSTATRPDPPPSITAAPSHAEPAPPQPYREPILPMGANAPAHRYARLSSAECEQELRTRKLRVKLARKPAPGIALAVRVKGHLNRVVVRKPAAPSPFGLLDCRLALALDDLTRVLARFDIIRVHIGSMYREGARIAHNGNKSQHASGLAMDILSLRNRAGRMLIVERDWHADVGQIPCGPDAVMYEPNPDAILLRNAICEVARQHIFHVMLTPSANRAHHDHMHFDISGDEDEQTVR